MNKPKLERTNSIRHKIIGLFFLVIAVPFLFIASYSYNKAVEGISNANASFSLDYLIQSAKNLEDYLENLNDKINDVIGASQLQELMRVKPKVTQEKLSFITEMTAFIYQKQSEMDVFRIRIYPIDPSAFPEYMRSLGDGNDVSSQKWFVTERETGEPSWHLFLPQDNKSLHSAPLITKIKRFSGLYDATPLGIIVTDLTEEEIQRFMSPPQKLQGQETFLLDENGRVLSHPRKEMIGKQISSSELLRFIQTKNEGTATINIDHTRSLVTYVKLRRYPWTLVSIIPLSVLTEPIKKISDLTVLFLGIYILCCIGVVIYITFYFTNPIVRLVSSMRKLETKDFLVSSLHSNRRDEIGWLYRGFDRMVKKIQELIAEIYKSEKMKKELEFQVLSHQINPHFLYNTLESIRWKAEQHHIKDISEMVSSLGNLLRLSLNEGKELTTVNREIEQVKAYVHIKKARLDKPFQIKFLIDDDILELPFLRLLLQPLIENAIHHGIRDNPEKGKIILSGKKDGLDLHFELNDNGEGIPEHVIHDLTSTSNHLGRGRKGVGLSNVNQRLELYFGDSYGLQIYSVPGEGTKIIIRHPILPPGFDGFR